MSIYSDTNFIVRLYLEKPESGEARALMAEHRRCLPVFWLLRLEVINGIEQSVFTGYGETRQRISHNLAAACQQHFRDDLREGIAMGMVDVPNAVLRRLVEDLSLRHTAKHGFRAYDLMHVAAALALKCKTFWSYDKRASILAGLEGLKTFS